MYILLIFSSLLAFTSLTTIVCCFIQQEFDNQQGEWFHTFSKPLPVVPTNDQLAKKNKKFSIKDVQEFVKRTGSLQGRLKFFEAFAAGSEFYQKVAKPLLSMGTVGSINVERRVKPMKESILTKKRNRLTDSKAIALFRARENLRHLMNAKKILGKKITDSF